MIRHRQRIGSVVFMGFVLLLANVQADDPLNSVVEVQIDQESAGHGILIAVDRSQAVGSGYIGTVATANHVIEKAEDIRVKYHNGSKSKKCQVIASDKDKDVALISVWVPAEVKPVRISRVAVQPGDHIIFVRRRVLHRGIAAVTTTKQRLFSDLTLKAGDSGGAVLNSKYEVVGVISGGWFWYDDEEKLTWPARASNTDALLDLIQDKEKPDCR